MASGAAAAPGVPESLRKSPSNSAGVGRSPGAPGRIPYGARGGGAGTPPAPTGGISAVASESAGPAPGIGWDCCGIGCAWRPAPPSCGFTRRSIWVDSPAVSGREAASGGSGATPGPPCWAPTGGISAVASASPAAGGRGAPVCGDAGTSCPDVACGCCGLRLLRVLPAVRVLLLRAAVLLGLLRLLGLLLSVLLRRLLAVRLLLGLLRVPAVALLLTVAVRRSLGRQPAALGAVRRHERRRLGVGGGRQLRGGLLLGHRRGQRRHRRLPLGLLRVPLALGRQRLLRRRGRLLAVRGRLGLAVALLRGGCLPLRGCLAVAPAAAAGA